MPTPTLSKQIYMGIWSKWENKRAVVTNWWQPLFCFIITSSVFMCWPWLYNRPIL